MISCGADAESETSFATREEAQAYIDSIIEAIDAYSRAEELEAVAAKQRRFRTSGNDTFPAPYVI